MSFGEILLVFGEVLYVIFISLCVIILLMAFCLWISMDYTPPEDSVNLNPFDEINYLGESFISVFKNKEEK